MVDTEDDCIVVVWEKNALVDFQARSFVPVEADSVLPVR